MKIAKWLIIALITFLTSQNSFAQVVNVGSGSYTLTFPGTDAAGRNGFPSGSPMTTGVAATKPVPTNDWWSDKIKNNHSSNLFNYPFTLKTVNQGLVISYIPWGPIDNILPITVGVSGLNASAANVSDFSDWTVTMDWTNANHNFTATAGIGMPFVYFEKAATDVAQITVNQGNVTISNEMMIIEDARNGADFAIYAPTGSTWIQNGNTYTSTLNGQNYWSLAFIPLTATNVTTVANQYKAYAYVFPTDTKANYSYDEATSVVTTDFIVDVDVKEGLDSNMLLGLLPHQWANLSMTSPQPNLASYATVRGELKTMASNTFTVENTFHGILPTLPYVDYYSNGFSPATLQTKVKLLENDGLATWTDSYNEGQEMNRLIQTARIAELTGDTVALNKLLGTVQTRLEDWLSYNSGEVAFLFYYNSTWSAMLGYPAGHGQDNNINDHHFHWGYFIHAASFVEQFNPGWAAQWGDMLNLLVRDAATADRNDNLFPYLRNFSPYAGHCWANGFASFPQGNDQESTSESMQFNSSLIHWGSVIGNDSIRDLGIYLYTTEQTAIEEYWFDMYNRNFGPNQQYSLVSRVWGNSYDNGTFWTADIAASYGIELYPIHGGSLYLGQDTNYIHQLWNEIEQNTGILTNDPNVNLWHDVMWEYLAFIDPQKAINLYDSYPNRNLKFGVSDAQTYHWLHAMNVLGNVDATITANHPLAAAFNKNGTMIYVGQNYGSTDSIDVVFSDGYTLNVPPNTLKTSLDINISGSLVSSFERAYPNGSVDLTATVNGGTATKVEFYDGENLVGQVTTAPYEITAGNLDIGRHNFYARIYEGSNFTITNIVTVTVGDQLPFSGTPIAIPGDFYAGDYDIFEGGNGNGIAYQDVSINNEGNYRTDEYVDAATVTSEGNTVGWIAAGEWLEYTIDVQQAGNYTLNFRYACGNNAGGGPMNIESDGIVIKSGISVNNTNGWNNWQTKTVSDVPLKSGRQILRLHFTSGELNVGKFTFTYTSPLTYNQPIADAGTNQIIVLPTSTGTLDGSASTNGGGGNLTYNWTQIYGSSVLNISNNQTAQPTFSNLEEGVYLMELEVNNGGYTDIDEVYIISSLTNNVAPTVAILTPFDGAEYYEGEDINITALASDLNDSIQQIIFYANGDYLATATQSPYNADWILPLPGNYDLTAVAYDFNGDSTISNLVNVEILSAPPCNGTSWNGDFNYLFSDADNNPTLTFIPSQTGVGSPTCILYYGTDPGNMPGYGVTPNVPFQINASEGETVYFYYTYSFPNFGERNNSANKDSYIVGTCVASNTKRQIEKLEVNYYPNPVTDILNIELPNGQNDIYVHDLTGKLLSVQSVSNSLFQYDMSNFAQGMYLITVVNDEKRVTFKVVK